MAEALNEPQAKIQNESDHVWPMSLILNPGYAMAFSCVKCQGIPKACMNNEDADIVCSKCAQNMDKVTAVKAVQKMINKLKTKCLSVSQNVSVYIQPVEETEGSNIIDTKVSDECDWTGQIQQYEEHGQECPFVVITCDKCNSFKCKRKLIDKHFGQCPEISIDCPLECGSKILRKNTEYHLQNVCVKQLLDCSNDDCKLQIERKSFKQHVAAECDSRIVHCEFGKYGCKMEHLRASDLKQHMDEYKFEHLSNKFDFVTTQLNNTIVEQQDKIVNLENQVKCLNDESKESTKTHQELREAIKSNQTKQREIVNLEEKLNSNSNTLTTVLKQVELLNDESKESTKIHQELRVAIKRSQSEQLVYTLRMSSHYGGPPDSYEHLITDNENMGAGTAKDTNQYILADLGAVKFVKYIEVKGCGNEMSGGWGTDENTNRYPCVLQYKNTNNDFQMLKDFRSKLMPSDRVTRIYVGQYTGAVRVFTSNGYLGCGTLRVFGVP